jgi:type VI secretion system protein ImpA
MPLPNLESLLQPISADDPCGQDMEYDAAFLELERVSQGKPEQQIGATIVAAQEPDWKDVGNRAQALLGKTKDVRVAMKLARAQLQLEGLAGLAEALAVLRGIVEQFWDGFYPKLDPDDGNDPTFRVNILMGLCDGDAFVDRIRLIPLVSARSFGRFSLRDIAMSTGEIPPPEGVEAPKPAAIDGAFNEVAVPALQAIADGVRTALEHLGAIEAFVADKVGASSGTNFAKLADVLRTADKILSSRLARRGVSTDTGSETSAEGADGTAVALGAGPSISGAINSREDVLRVLDKIIDYYERAEPSSPIPLLIRRSKRLVSASFMDIVRDIASDGLTQVENLRGKEDESNSS